MHVIAGPESGRVVDLEEGALVIGRSAEVGLPLAKDTALSRSHAELALAGGTLRLRDLGSKHGTFVNGVRQTEAILRDGDRVQLGESVLRVEAGTLDATLPSLPLEETRRDPRSSAPHLEATQREGASGTYVPVRCQCGATASREPMHARDEDVVYVCDRCQAQLAVAPALPPGYELVRLLGRGAMGSVFLARDPDGALRAIKQILPRAAMSAQMRKLFLREAAVQARLVHPNIVRVHELVEPTPGGFSIVMEYVDGISADALLAGGRVVEPPLVIAIATQALAGLEHAHAQAIVHRDIKEPNLMLVFTGAGVVVKIADFGLAKNFHESGASGMTNDGALGGTLPYMPREQLLDFRYVKPSADVYALGATMYRLLTGCYPRDYRDGENAVLVSLERPIVPLRARRGDLPPRLCAIVERALEQDVADRWPSAAAMRAALLAL